MRKSIHDILCEIAEKYRIGVKDLIGPCRRKMVSWPRQEAMFLAFTQCPHLSYPEIGRLMNKHHTTVLFGVQRYCERNGLNYEALAATRHSRAIEGPVSAYIRFQAPQYAQTMEAAFAW